MDVVVAPLSGSALAATLGTPFAPLLVDVRDEADFRRAHRFIPAALRVAPTSGNDWLDAVAPDRRVVFYCSEGGARSRQLAVRIGEAGWKAGYLEGGFDAWVAAGRLTACACPEVGVPAAPGRPSTWVTRERPKIDRIACPWLIRRFLDPIATFRYVPTQQVAEASAGLHAVPYDIPDARFSHRGDRCSFDAFLTDFDLGEPALGAVATIVRGADTGRLDLAPQSPGLTALSLGLSALYLDDHEMLAQGVTLYDWLYAWARFARTETHDALLFERARASAK